MDLKGVYCDLRVTLSFFERMIVPAVLSWFGLRKRPQKGPILAYVSWLDGNQANVVKNFLMAEKGLSYGPKIKGVQRNERVVLPAVNLYRFKHAECSGSSSSVLHNRKLILERVQGVDPRRCNYACGEIRRIGASRALVRRDGVETLDKGIFLGGNGAFNYYHWMVEIAPKLEFLPDLDPEFAGYPLLVDQSTANAPTLMEALNCLKGDREIVILERNVIYHVGDLLYMNAPVVAPFNLRGKESFKAADFLTRKDSVLFIRETLLSSRRAGGQAKMLGERLFLARRGNRRNYNQDEIFEVFEREGFIKVFLEDYALHEQIELVSSAKMIAGPSGAAWTNIVFFQPGAKGLCWMDERLLGFCTFSNLAHCVDVDLRYVTYRTDVDATDEFYSAHYQVDVEEIKRELSSMLSEVKAHG